MLCRYTFEKKTSPTVKGTCSSSWSRRVDRMGAEGGGGGATRRPGAAFAAAPVGGGGTGFQRAGGTAGAAAPGGAGESVAAVLAAAAAAGNAHLGQCFAAPARRPPWVAGVCTLRLARHSKNGGACSVSSTGRCHMVVRPSADAFNPGRTISHIHVIGKRSTENLRLCMCERHSHMGMLQQ